MVSRIVILSVLVVVANAATWMGHLPMKPLELAHKTGCYIQEINEVIPFGQQVAPEGSCVSIECSRHFIYYNSCGVVGTEDKNCHVTGYNNRKAYPVCCPTVKCDTENNIDLD